MARCQGFMARVDVVWPPLTTFDPLRTFDLVGFGDPFLCGAFLDFALLILAVSAAIRDLSVACLALS
jgi:hypothetical protein